MAVREIELEGLGEKDADEASVRSPQHRLVWIALPIALQRSGRSRMHLDKILASGRREVDRIAAYSSPFGQVTRLNLCFRQAFPVAHVYFAQIGIFQYRQMMMPGDSLSCVACALEVG